MTHAFIDDHLLRDVMAGDLGDQLRDLARDFELATTNLYYLRLCKGVATGRGGQLTGHWAPEPQRALGRRLLQLPDSILIVPIRVIGYRMAELADSHRVSTLGAEAVAAAEHLGAHLYVWDGDDGPGIRAAAHATGVGYHTVRQ